MIIKKNHHPLFVLKLLLAEPGSQVPSRATCLGSWCLERCMQEFPHQVVITLLYHTTPHLCLVRPSAHLHLPAQGGAATSERGDPPGLCLVDVDREL